MGAGPKQTDLVVINLVDQQPIGRDVTLQMPRPIADQKMRPGRRRRHAVPLNNFNDCGETLGIEPAPAEPLQILAKTVRGDGSAQRSVARRQDILEHLLDAVVTSRL